MVIDAVVNITLRIILKAIVHVLQKVWTKYVVVQDPVFAADVSAVWGEY